MAIFLKKIIKKFMLFFRHNLVYLTLIAIFVFVLLAFILENIRKSPQSRVTITESSTTIDLITIKSPTILKPTAIINFCDGQLGNQVCHL